MRNKTHRPWVRPVEMVLLLSVALLLSLGIRAALGEPSPFARGASLASTAAGDPGRSGREPNSPDDFSDLVLSLSEVLECTSVALLGVESWHPGDGAEYLWTPRSSAQGGGQDEPPRAVSLRCLRPADSSDAYLEKYSPGTVGAAWMEWKGVKSWRGQPMDTYRLVGPHSLRITEATPAYDWYPNYFPSSTTVSFAPRLEAIHWTRQQEVDLSLAGRELTCCRLDLRLGGGEQLEAAPQASLWLAPGFGPLNLVRLEARSGVLEWVGEGSSDVAVLPKSIEMVVSGRSCLDRFCASCHDDDHHTIREVPH